MFDGHFTRADRHQNDRLLYSLFVRHVVLLESYDMSAFFRDARLKIQRANKHFADLRTDIVSLETTYAVTVENNPDTGHKELVHTIPNFDETCLNLSLIIGDVIHNLHTALDFAWVSTIEINAPEINSKFTKFPVRKTREELEAALRGVKVDILSPALFTLIVSDIQPFEAGQSGVIYPLHELDISDKHLLLLELVPYAGIKGIVIRDKDGQIFRGSGMTVQSSGPYIVPFERDTEIEDKGELSVAITVKDAGIFHGLEVLDMLSGFSQYVNYVVHLLEKL
jgi:hypothetical protein